MQRWLRGSFSTVHACNISRLEISNDTRQENFQHQPGSTIRSRRCCRQFICRHLQALQPNASVPQRDHETTVDASIVDKICRIILSRRIEQSAYLHWSVHWSACVRDSHIDAVPPHFNYDTQPAYGLRILFYVDCGVCKIQGASKITTCRPIHIQQICSGSFFI